MVHPPDIDPDLLNFELLLAAADIDRPFFAAAASEGTDADGNDGDTHATSYDHAAAKQIVQLRKQRRSGFNGFSLYKSYTKHCIIAGEPDLSLKDYVHRICSSGSLPVAGIARNKTNASISKHGTEGMKGLKLIDKQFLQEWKALPPDDREQYNRFARAVRNIRD